MKRVHYIDNYLLNPQHPVTVNLVRGRTKTPKGIKEMKRL